MLYIDVGNTLRGGLRTGIQRVVRSLAFELAKDRTDIRLIAFDPTTDRYFALARADLIRSAGSMAEIGEPDRHYFNLDAIRRGDIFFEPDSTWSEPVPRGDLFRRLKAKGVIVVILNHDVIPVLLPEVCHPNTLISFSETIADHLQYADYALATSHGVEKDLQDTAKRYLGRALTTRVIRLGADFDLAAEVESKSENGASIGAAFPELSSLRYLLAVGTIEPRKNYEALLQAFDRLDAEDAALVVVGRQGWMSEAFLAALKRHPQFGKRIFWYNAVEDSALLALYRGAHAAVLPSHYEGYGLPAVEALRHGCPTIVSDAGSLPEVTGGHAEVFARANPDALFAVLDRLYRDESFRAELLARAAAFRPTSWCEAGDSVKAALEEIAVGHQHQFDAPLRQLVYLATNPEILALSLASVRRHLSFIDRIVVLTKANAKAEVEVVARKHFADAIILTDEELPGAELASAEHQPRNTWLRKLLYRHQAIEPNFLVADEDYLVLKPVAAERFMKGGVHTGHYFLDDMGGWFAGSPAMTSYDRGIRNAWKLLKQAVYPTRGYASHMPQVLNKRLVNEIYDRLVISPEKAWLDEWSIYFNVAGALYPLHFTARPYAALGWPMRIGDWYPEIVPEDFAFENYYPENYEAGGLFAGLQPLGDLETKSARTREAFAHAKHVEFDGGGAHAPAPLALIVGEDGLTFINKGTILAGRVNVRRILLINRSGAASPPRGTLEMFVTEPLGAPIRGETVALGEVCWIPLIPPERAGLYAIRFFAALEDGRRLETQGLLTIVAAEPQHPDRD
jgi:glycosyltransferase involved in cell wall biosynthesis